MHSIAAVPVPGAMQMRAALVVLTLLCGAQPALAQSVLERVRDHGQVDCGGVARPGLAQTTADGSASGLLADICRAVAVAVLGPPGRFQFHAYEADADFERVRAGRDDIAFLTGAEINAHGIAGTLLPGPTVFVARNAVMVPVSAREQHLGELAGSGICYLIGASAERSLESWFERAGATWLRHAYSEDGEMADAYAAQRCHAMAGEATWLARQRARRNGGASDRLLPEPLNVFPLIAATGTTDGRWSAIVGWTMTTLVNADRPQTRWYAGGADAMPLAAPELGLAADWQKKVLAQTGSYGAIHARHFGAGSPVPLEPLPAAGAVSEGTRSPPPAPPVAPYLAPYVE